MYAPRMMRQRVNAELICTSCQQQLCKDYTVTRHKACALEQLQSACKCALSLTDSSSECHDASGYCCLLAESPTGTISPQMLPPSLRRCGTMIRAETSTFHDLLILCHRPAIDICVFLTWNKLRTLRCHKDHNALNRVSSGANTAKPACGACTCPTTKNWY